MSKATNYKVIIINISIEITQSNIRFLLLGVPIEGFAAAAFVCQFERSRRSRRM